MTSIPEGCTVIHGKVYDISKFQSRHPGGARLIQAAMGADASANFYAYHPPSTDALLGTGKVPCVGVMQKAPATSVEVSTFYKPLREEVWKTLKSLPNFRKQGHAAKAVFHRKIRVFLVVYTAMVASIGAAWWSFAVVLAVYLATLEYPATFALYAHMLDHLAVYTCPTTTDVALHASVPFGVRATEFITAAHHMHHSHTRVMGLDQTVANDWPVWMVRLTNTMPVSVANTVQVRMMRMLLFVKPAVDSLLDSWLCLRYFEKREFAPGFSGPFMPKPLARRWFRPSEQDRLVGRYDALGINFSRVALHTVVYTLAVIASPHLLFFWLWTCGWRMGIVLWSLHVLTQARGTWGQDVESAAYAMHINSRIHKWSLDMYGHTEMISLEEHRIRDWGLQQVVNSGNLEVDTADPNDCPAGALWQVEHHLFPGIASEYFPVIAPVVRRHLKRYNMCYDDMCYTRETEAARARDVMAFYSTTSTKLKG